MEYVTQDYPIPNIYKDVSAELLRLSFVRGNFDPSELLVYQRNQLQFPSYTLEAGIIGASHFVWIRFSDPCRVNCAELFACLHVSEGDEHEDVIFSGGLSELSVAHHMHSETGVVYQCTVNKYTGTSTDKLLHDFERRNLAGLGPDSMSLMFDFPAHQEINFNLPPKTIVQTKVHHLSSVDVITTRTLHVYSHEDTCIESVSSLTIQL